MDFRIPGLPHSVVKQAEISRVWELVKKIENHPNRHVLQQDFQQNKKRSAQHAYHTGVQASSVAHAGIS